MQKSKAIGVYLGADYVSAWVADPSGVAPAEEKRWPNPELTDEHRAALPPAVLAAWRLKRVCEGVGADPARDIFVIALPPEMAGAEQLEWSEAAAIVGMKQVVFWSASAMALLVASQLKGLSDQGASVTAHAPPGDETKRRAWQALVREHDDLDLLAAAAGEVESATDGDGASESGEGDSDQAAVAESDSSSTATETTDEPFSGVGASGEWGVAPGESPLADLGIEKPIYSRQRSGVSGMKMAIINAIGFSVCSILGLVLGYYILVWLRPDKNFLDLNLPGIQSRDDVSANGNW